MDAPRRVDGAGLAFFDSEAVMDDLLLLSEYKRPRLPDTPRSPYSTFHRGMQFPAEQTVEGNNLPFPIIEFILDRL